MADLCIVYASPDRSIPQALEDALSPTYTVWWDDKIAQGDYRAEIERQLALAKCVLAVWSNASRANPNVIDEAEFAKDAGIPIISVMIEDVKPPLGFGSLQRVDLIGWNGSSDHPGVTQLLGRLAKVVLKGPRTLPRPQNIVWSGRELHLPVFFHSVSSYETQLRPEDAVQALGLFGVQTILISAYDIAEERRSNRMIDALADCRSAGALVLLDSGNYEASRKADNTWSAERLRRVLEETPHDLAFTFDDLAAPPDVDSIVRGVVRAVERDAGHTSAPVLPIIHAPRDREGGYDTDPIPEVMRRVAQELRPPLLAIPERELGPGILARAKMVLRIRRGLDELGFYQPLHLLGTGNPISIAIMAAAGADSFDGLEWCRVVADAQTGLLYHFQQYDFFAFQSGVAKSSVTRAAASSEGVNYAGQVVFHNLDFYSEWMDELRRMVLNGRVDRFLSEKLPKGSMRQLEQALPEVL